MILKIASLNAKDLRDGSKAACLHRDLLSFGLDVVTIQETLCEVDARVLSNGYVVFSAYADKRARDISLLVMRTLDARFEAGCSWPILP